MPSKWLLMKGVIAFLMTLLINCSLQYDITPTFANLFRSSNLILSELLSIYRGRKRFSWIQAMACMIVSSGVILISTTKTDLGAYPGSIPLILLTLSVITTLLFAETDVILARDKVDYGTSILYTYGIASLLYFPVMLKANANVITELPTFSLTPIVMLYCISQILCISAITVSNSTYSPVVTILFISLRKIVTMVISAYWFPLAIQTSIAGIMIFGGSGLYMFYDKFR
jgi:hypothetical protein